MDNTYPVSSEMADGGLFNELQHPIHSTYQGLCYNPPQLPDNLFRPESIQELDQSVSLLDGGKNESSNYCVGSRQQLNPYQVPSAFPFVTDNIQSVSLFDGAQDESSNCYDIQQSNGLDNLYGLVEGGVVNNLLMWQRIKWTDQMVRLLVTASSYVGDDSSSDVPKRDKGQLIAPIKGKWKAISNAMVERGFFVSPQKCEDKFNELNKKYRRLNDLLGRSNSCDIVENPALVESIDIPNEAKEEAKRILGCKQVFYHEMYSYHNQNRKYLSHDEALQESVQMSLRRRVKSSSQNGMPGKRQKQKGVDGVSIQASYCSPQDKLAGSVNVHPEAVEGGDSVNQGEMSHWQQLEEKRLQIEMEMLELERKKVEWLKSCQVKESELHEMKLENELLRFENERLASDLKLRGNKYCQG